MVGVGIFMILLALALTGLASADQRALWWRFKARHFRDPAANEPSASAFRQQRVAGYCAAVVMVGMAVWTFVLAAQSPG